MKLLVFTNHRAIRDFIVKNYEKKSLLDKLLTIDEFEKRAQIFQNRKFIDDDQRAILLKEAADFGDFDLLKIEKDFLKFIKSSTAILKFFEELTKEGVTFEDIQRADTYAEYDSHLNVLKILFSRYLALLDEHLYVDPINAPMIYEINDDYLKNFKEIHIFF
ncbi:MAG: ATP-dependent helicase/nuclease subunit [Campylobacterota bacterium]|nr:ATP-dependent helicase/nuclease subunit [Campylobacterota bacterium]